MKPRQFRVWIFDSTICLVAVSLAVTVCALVRVVKVTGRAQVNEEMATPDLSLSQGQNKCNPGQDPDCKCDKGEHREGNKCVKDTTTCPRGTHREGGKCVP